MRCAEHCRTALALIVSSAGYFPHLPPYHSETAPPAAESSKSHVTKNLVWVSRSPVTAPVVAHTPIISRVLDIPSPLSTSSIWVSVSVSVRRCYRFSGLYAFHSSDSVAVGIPQRRIAVLMAYNTTASSTLALLQCSGHWAHHIRSKNTHLRMTLELVEGGVRRGVGPHLLVLMVRLLAERYHKALSRWKHYALCSQSLSLFVVSATF